MPFSSNPPTVITYGSFAGAYEVVKDALTGQGVTFAKVGIQPGGPQGNGRWNGVPVVTLPGNPVSVLVSFEVFLRPALLSALGHTEVDRHRTRARLTEVGHAVSSHGWPGTTKVRSPARSARAAAPVRTCWPRSARRTA